MKFVDEAIITVQSGNGGRGCVSFRREKFIPRGGPDGGDGGDGGHVVLKATRRKRTLYQFHSRNRFKAENGQSGRGQQKTGRKGRDLIIDLPPGTMVLDADSGRLLKDLVHSDDTFIVARGGRGGRGNRRFASATNRTPRFAQPGEAGQSLTVKLELKLLADIGIIGMPNAGKSTLISVLSSARPKIGDYPFTTLTPNLGVVHMGSRDPFVMADIPGLIEGAHQGAGLGTRFLKHIERTRLLLHLIDAAGLDRDDPLKVYRTVCRELAAFSRRLAAKPHLVVLNKLDLPEAQAAADRFRSAAAGTEVLLVSAATGQGIDRLKVKLLELLNRLNTIPNEA